MTDRTSVPNGAWLRVADDCKAMLHRHAHPAVAGNQADHGGDPNPRTHDQGPDRPGRVFAGSHPRVMDKTDLHAQNGCRFLEPAAVEIDACGPPMGADHCIGRRGAAISDAVPAAGVGEPDSDPVHLPVARIAEPLAL